VERDGGARHLDQFLEWDRRRLPGLERIHGRLGAGLVALVLPEGLQLREARIAETAQHAEIVELQYAAGLEHLHPLLGEAAVAIGEIGDDGE
jgi:hypothetical protein